MVAEIHETEVEVEAEASLSNTPSAFSRFPLSRTVVQQTLCMGRVSGASGGLYCGPKAMLLT